jgi:hypothetical protein
MLGRIGNMPTIVARWRDWLGQSIEHLVLNVSLDRIVADAAVIGTTDGQVFAARYKICCDSSWRVRNVLVNEIGSNRTVALVSDGVGNWNNGAGIVQSELANAIDVDISITPFTNTLPIRRLNLARGESHEILAVYIRLPNIAMTTDRQRYTCLETGRRYLYESLDSDFTREIEFDAHGLLTNYPGLFRRVL